jgi:Lrp/AsnC family transcriptional regulator, leucine-responsive regulatory protein
MSEDWEKLLDDAGWNMLDELQRNARVSFAELGRRVGLITPAVLERVHKMEASGSFSVIMPSWTARKRACPLRHSFG